MSIEYEIIDILRIIKKKWYVIIGLSMVCMLISIPLSRISYVQAEENYEQEIMKTAEIDIVNVESYIYIQANDMPQDKIDAVGKDIGMIIKKKGMEKVEYEYFDSINAIRIYAENIDVKDWNVFITEIEQNINDILLKHFKSKIWIEIETIQNPNNDIHIGEIILEKPSQTELGIKLLVKAGIFGCLLGVALVLIVDYTKCCKMIIAMNK